ncbi:17893_t:CDS:2, partial [Cetraspora pellucida]
MTTRITINVNDIAIPNNVGGGGAGANQLAVVINAGVGTANGDVRNEKVDAAGGMTNPNNHATGGAPNTVRTGADGQTDTDVNDITGLKIILPENIAQKLVRFIHFKSAIKDKGVAVDTRKSLVTIRHINYDDTANPGPGNTYPNTLGALVDDRIVLDATTGNAFVEGTTAINIAE